MKLGGAGPLFPAGKRRLSLVPRSLFGRHMFLIIALVSSGQLLTALLYHFILQRPHLDDLASSTVEYVLALESNLASLPPADAARFAANLNLRGHFRVIQGKPDGVVLPISPGVMFDAYAKALGRKMHHKIDVRWEGEERRLWLSIPLRGSPYWVQVSGDRLVLQLSRTWLSAVALSALLAILGALYLTRRLNRPIARLVRATSDLAAGRPPEYLPDDKLPTELAKVAHSFNGMAESLARYESERSMMLAGISHDLRTPLTKMRLGLAMSGDEELEAMMARQIEQIDAILGQFMDYARNGSEEPLSEVDVNRLIQDAIALQTEPAAWQLDLAPLPQTLLPRLAWQRLIANLLENAWRHAGKGLEVATRQEGDQISLSVLDRGPGVPPESLSRLSQPFVRLAGTPGTGLGLAIVAKLVRRRGGELSMLPRDGGGLEARVRWPIQPPPTLSSEFFTGATS